MFGIGPAELLVILLIALLVVGPERLPEVSRRLGRAIREFRRVSGEAQQQIRQVLPLDDLNPFSAMTQPPTAPTQASKNPAATHEAPKPVDLGPPVEE